MQRNSTIELVVSRLTDAVLSEKNWLPGDRLPNERQLAEQFQVSRNTLREAIKVLNANHILVTKPHSGTYVASNPGTDGDPFGFAMEDKPYQLMQDLYEMRMVMECAAIRMAVQRASNEEIQNILYYDRLCRELIKSGQPWSEADRKFHASIAEASHNLGFIRVIPSIHQSAHLGYVMMDEDRNKANTLKYHPLIAEALFQRDEVGAALAARHHLMQALKDLKDVMKESGEVSVQEEKSTEEITYIV